MSNFTKGTICVMGAIVLTLVGVLLVLTALPVPVAILVGVFATIPLAGVGLLVYAAMVGIRKALKGG